MRTPKSVQIELKVNELMDKFTNYLRPLFEEWKCVVSNQIQEKIMYPLFTMSSNKTIRLNFPKEVIKYNFKLFIGVYEILIFNLFIARCSN